MNHSNIKNNSTKLVLLNKNSLVSQAVDYILLRHNLTEKSNYYFFFQYSKAIPNRGNPIVRPLFLRLYPYIVDTEPPTKDIFG